MVPTAPSLGCPLPHMSPRQGCPGHPVSLHDCCWILLPPVPAWSSRPSTAGRARVPCGPRWAGQRWALTGAEGGLLLLSVLKGPLGRTRGCEGHGALLLPSEAQSLPEKQSLAHAAAGQLCHTVPPLPWVLQMLPTPQHPWAPAFSRVTASPFQSGEEVWQMVCKAPWIRSQSRVGPAPVQKA